MYRILFLLSIIFIAEALSAQYIEVSYPQKVTAKVPRFRVLGKYSKGYVVERYGSDKHLLDVYDTDLNFQFTKELKNKKDLTINEIWLQPQGAWLVYTELGKNNSVLKSLWLDSRFNIADKIMVLDTIHQRKDWVQANLRYDYSDNHTHTGYFMPIFENGDIDHFLILTMNAKMQSVVNKKIVESHLNGLDFINAEIMNNGHAVLIFKQQTKKGYQGVPEYVMFYVGPQKMQKFIYRPARAIHNKPLFQLDNQNNRLIVSGYYQSDVGNKKNNGAEAVFMDILNLPDGRVVTSVSDPITNDFYFNLTGKQVPPEGAILYTFYMNRIVPKTDGGAIIIAESYYKDEEEVPLSGVFVSPTINNYRTITTYHYNDIIIYDYDANGNMEDTHIVRKRQQSEGDKGAYSSFGLMNARDRIRLLFLDEITNNASMVEYSFSDNWAEQQSTIFSVGAKEVMPVSKMAKQTGINELIVPGFQNNFLSLIKIVY